MAKRVLLDCNPVLFELLFFSCTAFILIGDHTSCDRQKSTINQKRARNGYNVSKALKQPFMQAFLGPPYKAKIDVPFRER